MSSFICILAAVEPNGSTEKRNSVPKRLFVEYEDTEYALSTEYSPTPKAGKSKPIQSVAGSITLPKQRKPNTNAMREPGRALTNRPVKPSSSRNRGKLDVSSHNERA